MNSPGETPGTKKPLVSGFFTQDIGVLQAGHLFDGALEVVIRAIGAGAFRRHGVDAGNGLGQDAVEAALVIGALFPGCLSPIFGAPSRPVPWQALQCFAITSAGFLAPPAPPAAVATSMPLHSFPWTQTWPTGSRRLAISSVVAAWALTAHRANTVAGAASIFIIRFTRTPSMVASHACGHGLQAGASIAVSPSL